MSTSEQISGAHTLGEVHGGTESSIGSLFALGREYYDRYRSATRPRNKAQIVVKSDMLTLAMTSCQHALTHTGTHKERLIKIDVLLLMMEIVTHTKPIDTWKRERYFYEAVEIARCSLGEDFLLTPHGQRLKESYCTYIDREFGENFNNKKWSKFTKIMQLCIKDESNKKIAQRMYQAMDNKSHIATKDTPQDILNKLEAVLGPVRLVIIAGESGEICMHHRIGRAGAECLQENSHGIYTTRVEVFHEKKTYQIIIDRGSREPTSMFDDAQIKNVIEPMLRAYIQKMEHLSFVTHADHSACIRLHEEKQNIGEPRDYTTFIERVLSHPTVTSGELDSAEDYTRSIDIARLMLSSSRSKTPPTTAEFYEQMDSILGGQIDRRVYHMVTSILLSRNETMHRTGYPFGLNQRLISLEAKLYAIIRAYETLQAMPPPNNPAKVISTLENWSGGGYLDRGLLSLFIGTLGESREVSVREKRPMTDYRIDRHTPYREGWEELITLTDQIEKLYDKFRDVGVSDDTQRVLVKRIDEKRLEIRRVARLRNMIILQRHEITESDIQDGGVPGNPHEGLTPIGMFNAEVKGYILNQLSLEIYTGPLPRTKETAKAICQKVNECMGNCARCPLMQTVDILTNPPKDRADGQSLSPILKFINFGGKSQKNLLQLVHDIISSSKQSTHLIITHGDIIRHLMLIIENIFEADKIIGLRHAVDHDRVITLLFEGDRIISWDLLFSISDWSVMIDTINTLTMSIFGDIFYESENKRVNLIRLRDQFLDYIDNKNEIVDQEKVGRFIQALYDNPLTQHFSAILRTEGLIKNPQE